MNPSLTQAEFEARARKAEALSERVKRVNNYKDKISQDCRSDKAAGSAAGLPWIPELDPGAAGSALALLIGGGFVLADRRKQAALQSDPRTIALCRVDVGNFSDRIRAVALRTPRRLASDKIKDRSRDSRSSGVFAYMNILVTGGAGFIGSNFLNLLVPRHPEHPFVNVDKLTYAANLATWRASTRRANYALERVDIADREAVASCSHAHKPNAGRALRGREPRGPQHPRAG